MAVDRRSFLTNLAGLGAAAAAGAWAVGASHKAPAAAPIRPPGALNEQEFLSTCIRCQRCVDACPNHCIEPMAVEAGAEHSGTPHIRPRQQACMLCSRIETDYLRCTESCPSGALQLIRKSLTEVTAKVHMGVAKVDQHLCYSYNDFTCGICHRACPTRAISVAVWDRPIVNEAACVGCGLCERVCIRYPHAIRVEVVERPSSEGAS